MLAGSPGGGKSHYYLARPRPQRKLPAPPPPRLVNGAPAPSHPVTGTRRHKERSKQGARCWLPGPFIKRRPRGRKGGSLRPAREPAARGLCEWSRGAVPCPSSAPERGDPGRDRCGWRRGALLRPGLSVWRSSPLRSPPPPGLPSLRGLAPAAPRNLTLCGCHPVGLGDLSSPDLISFFVPGRLCFVFVFFHAIPRT